MLIRVDRSSCRDCALRQPPPAPPVPARRRRTSATGPRVGDAKVDPSKLGVFADAPGSVVRFAVAGKPVPQGSLRAVAAGVIKRESGPELVAWRTAIHRAMLSAVGLGGIGADCPLRVHAVFTVPMTVPKNGGVVGSHTVSTAPDSSTSPRVAPSTAPDLDKLIRAAGDAITPRKRWRLFADDSRIVEWSSAKTYPRPEHVHPWALSAPGVVLQVSPLDVAAVFPSTTLSDPGPCPAEIADILPAALRAA